MRSAVAKKRLRRIATDSVLVTASDDQHKIAHAAWSIVAMTGGLLDRVQIAERYGISRGRVHTLTRQKHFPRAVQGAHSSHPLWLAIDVERYRAQPPPVGRPPKSPSNKSM